jgi:hypothetical protein
VFGYPDPTEHVRYLVNYEGGNPGVQWLYGDVGGDTATVSDIPDVTLLDGGGTGIIYGYRASTRECRFTWRHYSGAWSTPVTLSNHEYAWLFRPGIEYLGTGVYGIVYMSLDSPIRGAFFDRTDWTGVAEQRRLVMEENILSVTPNPLSGRGRLNCTLNRPADLRVQVYDRAGRVVRTLSTAAVPQANSRSASMPQAWHRASISYEQKPMAEP